MQFCWDMMQVVWKKFADFSKEGFDFFRIEE
jgi:hypothetical protein